MVLMVVTQCSLESRDSTTQRHALLAYQAVFSAMSSLTAGAHFPWIVEEEEEEQRRAMSRGISKRVTWNSSVQVRSISPRPRKVGMGPPAGNRPPVVGLFSRGHGAIENLEELQKNLKEVQKNMEELHNKENKDKTRTLVSLRMLSQSTKALIGQMT